MSNSDFAQSIAIQLGTQLTLGYGPDSFETEEDRMNYMRDTCLALNLEVAEFLQELPWKPWRPFEQQTYRPDKAADEIIDILIFTLNLWINFGQYPQGKCYDELMRRLDEKQYKNLSRIQSGYNTKKQ